MKRGAVKMKNPLKVKKSSKITSKGMNEALECFTKGKKLVIDVFL